MKNSLLNKVKSFTPVLHQSYRTTATLTFDKDGQKGHTLTRDGSFTLDLRKTALYGAAFGVVLYCIFPKKK